MEDNMNYFLDYLFFDDFFDSMRFHLNYHLLVELIQALPKEEDLNVHIERQLMVMNNYFLEVYLIHQLIYTKLFYFKYFINKIK